MSKSLSHPGLDVVRHPHVPGAGRGGKCEGPKIEATRPKMMDCKHQSAGDIFTLQHVHITPKAHARPAPTSGRRTRRTQKNTACGVCGGRHIAGECEGNGQHQAQVQNAPGGRPAASPGAALRARRRKSRGPRKDVVPFCFVFWGILVLFFGGYFLGGVRLAHAHVLVVSIGSQATGSQLCGGAQSREGVKKSFLKSRRKDPKSRSRRNNNNNNNNNNNESAAPCEARRPWHRCTRARAVPSAPPVSAAWSCRRAYPDGVTTDCTRLQSTTSQHGHSTQSQHTVTAHSTQHQIQHRHIKSHHAASMHTEKNSEHDVWRRGPNAGDMVNIKPKSSPSSEYEYDVEGVVLAGVAMDRDHGVGSRDA